MISYLNWLVSQTWITRMSGNGRIWIESIFQRYSVMKSIILRKNGDGSLHCSGIRFVTGKGFACEGGLGI